MIELRPDIPGFYKGLIYCRGLNQAEEVKNIVNVGLENTFTKNFKAKIKRGCSEYPLKFPEYGVINTNEISLFEYPEEWKYIEENFDNSKLIEPKKIENASLPEFCLADFYIIQKWIDYAKGIRIKHTLQLLCDMYFLGYW